VVAIFGAVENSTVIISENGCSAQKLTSVINSIWDFKSCVVCEICRENLDALRENEANL
jgi:hypothetical protein